jgi:hypothetical protein
MRHFSTSYTALPTLQNSSPQLHALLVNMQGCKARVLQYGDMRLLLTAPAPPAAAAAWCLLGPAESAESLLLLAAAAARAGSSVHRPTCASSPAVTHNSRCAVGPLKQSTDRTMSLQ